MAVYTDTVDDDSCSVASTATANVSTTTRLLNNTTIEDRDAGRTMPVSASKKSLYTPIPVPQPFDPSATELAITSDNLAEYMAKEEAAASAIVHAGCRLHEASCVMVNAYQRLIFNWTGLSPDKAATSLKNTDAYPKSTGGRQKATDKESYQQRAEMLYGAVEVVEMVSQMLGNLSMVAIVGLRKYSVDRKLLLRLSALEPMPDSGNYTEKDTSKDTATTPTPTIKTYVAFTRTGEGDTWTGVTWDAPTLIYRLRRTSYRANNPFYGFKWNQEDEISAAMHNGLNYPFHKNIMDTVKKRDAVWAELLTKGAKDVKDGERNRILYTIQAVVQDLAVDLVQASKTLCDAADFAYRVARWQRKLQYATASVFASAYSEGNANSNVDVNDPARSDRHAGDVQLLGRAHKAATQASEAAKIALAEYREVSRQFSHKPEA